jgi:hypothetical protein
MGHPPKLVKNSCIQLGMTMAMKIGPNGGVSIQETLSIG